MKVKQLIVKSIVSLDSDIKINFVDKVEMNPSNIKRFSKSGVRYFVSANVCLRNHRAILI